MRSPNTAFIHILDDDSLLSVFYLYRPFLFRKDEVTNFSKRMGDGLSDPGGINLPPEA
jgi:hypothetical protein